MRSTLFLKIEFAYLPGIAQSRPRPHPQPCPGHSRGRNHSHKSRFHSYKAPIPCKRGMKKAVCAQLSEENYATNGYSHKASKQLGISAASARWPALRLRPWWRWHAPWHGRARASSASAALMSDSACLRSAVARTTSSCALDRFSPFGFHRSAISSSVLSLVSGTKVITPRKQIRLVQATRGRCPYRQWS